MYRIVGEQVRIEIVELLCSIQRVHEHGADQVNGAQQSLGVDVPVGDQADEEEATIAPHDCVE